MIGVDKTHSIALDEIFGFGITPKDENGYERESKVYRKTRATVLAPTEKKISDEGTIKLIDSEIRNSLV